MRRWLIVLMLASPVLLSAQQQPPAPVFRSSSQLVTQTIVVKDKNGAAIEGLTSKDFVVTENGERQEIAFAEFQKLDGEVLPLKAPVAADALGIGSPITSGVSVPLPGDARYRGRRLLVLYIDLYNMPFFDELRVYGSASNFVSSKMTPADMLALMVFKNGRVQLAQDFTDDRARLLKTIHDLEAAASDQQNASTITASSGAFGEDDETFNLFSTDRQLAALQTAVTGLGPLPEVKTLIYLGSGLRLNGADNLAQLRATVNAAVRSNVTINPIDTRGLTAAPPLGDATKASPGGIGMFSGAIAQTATTRQQQSQDSYYALAKDTGGRAMFDSNDLAVGIAQAANAVTSYYIIGYYTKNTASDGRYRRVKVELANHVSADLSYRAGYYGAKDYSKFNSSEKERQLEDALRLEDPITDIPMAMEINYFQVSNAEYFVPISVRMPASDLIAAPSASAPKASKVEIDIIGEIKDSYGVTIRNSKDKAQFKLDPSTASDVVRRPVQYETGFSLLPGSYVIKMLARDTTTGRIGTFQKDFVVPNLEKEKVRLPISTVVLTTQAAAYGSALYTVKQKIAGDTANPLVVSGQQLIPSVARTFSTSRGLYVFLQAYERDAANVRPLVAFTALYQNGVKVLESEPVTVAQWDAKSKTLSIQLGIPLQRLSAGVYDMQVTVLDPVGNKAAFWRSPVSLVK